MRADDVGVRRWSIRNRLLLGLMVIVALMTVDAWIIIRQQQVMDRTFGRLQGAETIERYLLECRRQEKNFLIRGDVGSVSLYESNTQGLLEVVEELRRDVMSSPVAEQLDVLEERIGAYKAAFGQLRRRRAVSAGLPADSTDSENETVAAARACHAVVTKLRSGTIERFQSAQDVTRLVSIASVAVGALLSIGIAGFLTRAIVGPLERLRRLAERISAGDIQDMDVELAGLDMRRFTSQESYDLARVLRSMVTNLRFLVPTERGLMDDYHMTILVLVNKALGSGGWAVIERARRAAGFDSLSEVEPENVECFLSELEREALEEIPEDRVQLLSRVIRELAT